MEICIIIRGPAGVGKTTVAKKLAKKINSDYFSFDEIMEKNNLDTVVGTGIPSDNFIKANEIIISSLINKKRVILDGCFYRKKQIKHILAKLKTKIYIFTLNASIAECLKRNKLRKHKLREEDIKQVHALASKINIGIKIDSNEKSAEDVVSEILNHIIC